MAIACWQIPPFLVPLPSTADYIAVVINVTDSGGNHDGIRERFVVDGSLPNRSVALARELLTVDFSIVCEMDHFGPRCARFCKPSPTNYRHIACSSTGEKICLAGWKGDNCSTVQDDGEENRVASQFTRIRERRSTLSHAGKHTLILGGCYNHIHMVGLLLVVLFGAVSTVDQSGSCHPHDCEYGECISEGPSFSCKCQQDYVGPTCNVWRSPLINCDVDGQFVCFNGGICNTTANSYRCVCPSNFTGFFCEEDVNECLLSPCENGATCVNRIGSYYCMCSRGFRGLIRRFLYILVLLPSTCLNGGRCIDGTGGYVCECPRGYKGLRCQDVEDIIRGNTNNTFDGVALHPDFKKSTPEILANLLCLIATAMETTAPVQQELLSPPAHLHRIVLECSGMPSVMRRVLLVCDVEACMYDGFDCVPTGSRCPKSIYSYCKERRSDNAKLYYFIANIPHFLSSLSQLLRADVHIKSDEKGPIIFLWKRGKIGERITIGKQKHPNSMEYPEILACVEIDVSRCVNECFSDIEVVANFIEATGNVRDAFSSFPETEFSTMNMSIRSAVARKLKTSEYWNLSLVVVMTCEKQRELNNEINGLLGFSLSSKRRTMDLSRLELLEKSLTSKLPRFSTLPRPKKLQPLPSQLHIESASEYPISFPLSTEEANKRGPYGRTALMVLARNTKRSEEQLIDDVTKLRAIGADMNLFDDRGDTALHMAVSSGRVALVRKLLQLGAAPVIRDGTNSNCLHLAARACASDMMAALLEIEEMRQEVDAVDDSNRTALMLVAMHDRVDAKAAQMLIEAGADVNYSGDNNLVSWNGRTALHFAAKYDNSQMVAFLVRKLAVIDCKDYENCTPLHLAAAEGRVGPVKELIRAGASVLMRNDKVGCAGTPYFISVISSGKFQTPYDVALLNSCHSVAALLVSGDNIRIQLYSNNGEIITSSSSPKCKHTKVLLARDTIPLPQCSKAVTTQMASSNPTPQSVAPTGHSTPYIQLLDSEGTPVNSRISPSHYEVVRECFAFPERSMEDSSGYVDSGFNTFTAASHHDCGTTYASFNRFLKPDDSVVASIP
uniref:Delta-like protein n=1 Tax=Angiostrongylus cantonensis TaxID=6313 RepID=A0A158P8Z6_ANGCA